jgi:hypothetical protein
MADAGRYRFLVQRSGRIAEEEITMKRLSAFALTLFAVAAVLTESAAADVVTDWNQTALRATEVAGFGPPPQTRAMATMHAAVYDAVNAIDRRHAVYAVEVKPPAGASAEAAAAAAAHGVLVGLFAVQRPTLDAALTVSLAAIAEGDARTQGLVVGREVATKYLELRKNDGAGGKVAYAFATGPGLYQLTPPLSVPPVLPHWRQVKPFALTSASQFALPGPPPLDSPAFTRDFNEVKDLGGRRSTTRTNEQTATAIFWAGSEIPPLNAIARAMAAVKKTSVVDNARLFAYLNMAMADSLIAGFDVKYRVNYWRPITAVRNAAALGSSALAADPGWESVLVTPPHPEYPSAHALAMGAAAEVLTGLLGNDRVETALVQPPLGVHRRWETLSQIVKEMEDARVWAGIHFRTSTEHGTQLGRRIGGYALQSVLRATGPSASR